MPHSDASDLTPEETRFLAQFRELGESELLRELGRSVLRESGVRGAAPPTPEASETASKEFLERCRGRVCDAIKRSPKLVLALLRPHELIDAGQQLSALIVCLRAELMPLRAVVLALIIVRHSIRWICPDLANQSGGDAGKN